MIQPLNDLVIFFKNLEDHQWFCSQVTYYYVDYLVSLLEGQCNGWLQSGVLHIFCLVSKW